MGVARPKTVVEDEEGLWLAKLNRPDDRWNHVRVEHAMLRLARRCGLSAAESRVVTVGGRDALLVKRFDRRGTAQGYERARMVSGLTLVRADETDRTSGSWSYIALAEELRRASAQPRKDTAELFRRSCFNALISNTDDHPRNHAVIGWERDWRLSPAFDLTPSVPISIEHRDLATVCGDAGRHANAENLLSQHARLLLDRDEAEAILADIERRVVHGWHDVARASGVSADDCHRISGAFVYPGFRYPLAGHRPADESEPARRK